MKKTLTLLGSALVALGLKAHAVVPARKETTPRPAIIKTLPLVPGELQQKQKPATVADKRPYVKSATTNKSPLPIKSAAVQKAAPIKTKHR